MKRIYHLLFTLIPPVLIALLSKSEEQMIELLMWHLAVIVPITTVLRMKYAGYSTKQIALAFVPFWGLKNRLRIFTKEKVS